ncbi:MAG: phosphatidate cytidylyltransferase [Lachnospiraceae bacterium]|nr:phosphatidate cytidylyltransferase [Lachnospiraceae bacterium]
MFITRTISGAVLVALAFAVIIPGGYVLAGATLLLSLIAYRELMKCCKLDGSNQKKAIGPFSDLELIGYISILGYYAVLIFTAERMLLISAIVAILILFMALYVFTFPKHDAKEIMMSFFCIAYAPLMLTFLYLTRELPYGKHVVWMIFISSWVCDTAAYCVGMLIGKHKLAPVLSPKKSIEGAIGGVVGSALAGAAFGYFVMAGDVPEKNMTLMFAIISAVGAVISQIGDLAASGIKRNQEIKDYGKLIPGHGGVMDRFDSVIFTAPMIYLLSLLLL